MSNSSPPENSVQEFIRSLRESSAYKDTVEDTLEITDNITFKYDDSLPATCYQYQPLTTINGGTSSNTITFTGGTGMTSNYAYVNSPSTYTISTSACIPSINSINLTGIFNGEDWVDQFPDFDKIQKMCEEYPGLKIAFEKFKTTYKLVRDHYDTPKDQRPRP
jgi:hypothetical protein